jgi:hydroxymethylpyrimidine pyrophosphatase-like HAD family hydrolase
MTDVDGTLTTDGDHFEPAVADSVARLQSSGIKVGLVSGRDLPRLLAIVDRLGIRGPLIAENGGVARLTPQGADLELGYSRSPAVQAVAKLKSLFPGSIIELDDNRNRKVDFTISSEAIPVDILRQHVPGLQVMDSGYMIHLMPEGISKGGTLRHVISKIGVSAGEVMVFGDSTTDLSLFLEFENSVLVHNPLLSQEQRQAVKGATAFESEMEVAQGFCEATALILLMRRT